MSGINASYYAAHAVHQVPIAWEEVSVTPILKDGKTAIPDDAIASVRRNTVALKGEHHARLSDDAALTAC
jgi:isocitrate dehydrogenase (NAD+)